MTREEVIEGINDKLKDLKYYAKEMEEVLKSTNYFINELERLKQPPTLADFLGWEEGQEYEYGDRFIIEDNSLYKTYDIADDEEYKFKRIVEVDWSSGNIEWLRQAKKVEEPKYKWRFKSVKTIRIDGKVLYFHHAENNDLMLDSYSNVRYISEKLLREELRGTRFNVDDFERVE